MQVKVGFTSARKAKVNNGPTQGAVRAGNGTKGQRATVVNGQSFAANEDGITVVKFDKAFVDKAKRDFQETSSQLIGDTHKSAEPMQNRAA